MRSMTVMCVVLLSASILACGGDEVAPALPEPVAAVQVAPPPAPVAIPADPTGRVTFTPAQIAAIHRARSEYDAITDAASLRKAWDDAQQLDLNETLSAAIDPDGALPTFDWLSPALPGVRVDFVGEGTMVHLALDPELWLAKARSTPEAVDDAFLALTNDQFHSGTTSGTPSWDELTWDYGGCSKLGTGAVFAAVQQAQTAAAAGDLFAAEIAGVRKRALDAVLVGDPGFQYCAVNGGPTPDAALQAEAQQILDEAKLSDEEKAALTARMPLLKGEEFSGG